jgi:histidinol-phosphate aminotransferase
VFEALHDAIGENLRLYPRPMSDELRERAARLYRLQPENVLVGNGSDELLAILMRACVDAGSRVAYPVPTYSLYDTLVQIHGGQPVHVPFPDDFSLPQALVAADARLIIVCNPNSPSGTLIPAESLRPLVERPGRLVAIDEAYVDFADANCLDLVREHTNVVVLRTLSKSYSLAGLRIGLALGAERLIETLTKVKDSYNVNRLSIVAGAAALRDLRWMEANVRRIRRTRDALTRQLVEMGFDVPPSQANFVLARRPGEDLGPLYEGLKRRGVLVRHFPTPDLRDALRITVGTDDEIAVLLRVLGQLVA